MPSSGDGPGFDGVKVERIDAEGQVHRTAREGLRFEYRNLRLAADRVNAGEATEVLIDVTNTGERAGDEVVQLYVRDQVSSVTRPVKSLKGFSRINLQPEETRTVSFDITPDKLALLDQSMEWRIEPGFFDVMVGGSSDQVDTIVLEVVD